MNERKDHPLFMISVIIPVFNGEKTIERAVHSILCNRDAETPIEIIIIDDGSTDATPTICDRLSEDTGIHVIHTENHGMVAARNIGIREAKGEYIGFVDSDDWIEPDMFQILLKTMIEQQADLVACGVIQETEQGSFRDEDDGVMIVSQFPFIYHDILLSTGFRGYQWNKLYKKELISFEVDNGITQCEDLLFNATFTSGMRCIIMVESVSIQRIIRIQNVTCRSWTLMKSCISCIWKKRRSTHIFQRETL